MKKVRLAPPKSCQSLPPRCPLYACLPVGLDPDEEAAPLARLRAACETYGWRVMAEYVDVAGGPAEEREELLAGAAAGRIEVAVCIALEAFAPGGVAAAPQQLARLRRAGCAFYSLTEPELSTVPGEVASWPSALDALAAFEARRHSNKVRAGIRRGRRFGRGAGWPRISIELRREILRLRQEEGKSVRATVRALGIARGTVTKYQDRPADDLMELVPPRAWADGEADRE